VRNNAAAWSLNQESVDLNAYLFAEKKYLAEINNRLGNNKKTGELQWEAEQLKKQIQELFFDEDSGWFYDIDLQTKELIKIQGPEEWTTLWTGVASPDQAEILKETMIDTAKFATYIPFPTLSASHPKFKPQNGYWRGPIWLDQVYFAIQGLSNYGFEEEAEKFARQVFARLEGAKDDDFALRENYHPLSGEGLESNHFSWTAAHLLMLMLEKGQQHALLSIGNEN
jgi:putative isomerase